MPSDKCNSITAKATGLIFSLFDVASAPTKGLRLRPRGHSRSKLRTKFEISQIFVKISRFEFEISKFEINF